MSKVKSVFEYSTISLSVIMLAGFFNAQAQASVRCKHFDLTSYVTFLGPDGPAVGNAEATFKHGVILPISATSEVTSTTTNEDGSIDMRVRELDDWDTFGSTIGIDTVKLIPTEIPGEFALSIKTYILGESGHLEDAFGLYKGTGTASFNDGTLTHSGKGTICNFRKKHVAH
ncbi:hypothetical protein MNBD_GAMMA13-1538 [hydrothermal vent metagenome]|uniref:Uncharacterized protein n=1 Tax=hydrothermal vent metagenome TaxID=652676 RepID=A0A3B0ZEJ3_9ZZZZ